MHVQHPVLEGAHLRHLDQSHGGIWPGAISVVRTAHGDDAHLQRFFPQIGFFPADGIGLI
eukprot:9494779-Pyramimonas_sp.AAC.2